MALRASLTNSHNRRRSSLSQTRCEGQTRSSRGCPVRQGILQAAVRLEPQSHQGHRDRPGMPSPARHRQALSRRRAMCPAGPGSRLPPGPGRLLAGRSPVSPPRAAFPSRAGASPCLRGAPGGASPFPPSQGAGRAAERGPLPPLFSPAPPPSLLWACPLARAAATRGRGGCFGPAPRRGEAGGRAAAPSLPRDPGPERLRDAR